MMRLSATAAVTAIAILTSPPALFAQGTSAPPAGSPASPQSASPPPGTNSAGTAQSSGRAQNTAAGLTTGSAGSQSSDAVIAEENKTVDQKLKSICRGC